MSKEQMHGSALGAPGHDELSDEQLTGVAGGAGVAFNPLKVVHGIEELSHAVHAVSDHVGSAVQPVHTTAPSLPSHPDLTGTHPSGTGADGTHYVIMDKNASHTGGVPAGLTVSYYQSDELAIKPKTIDDLGSLFHTSDPKINAIMSELAGAALSALPVGGIGASAGMEIAKMGVKIAEAEIKHEVHEHLPHHKP